MTDFRPLKGKIFVTEMDEGAHKTAGGIILRDASASAELNIRPRWAKVAFVAPDIDYVSIGEWVLVEHGRWTQRMKIDQANGSKMEIWMVEPKAILLVSSENKSLARI